MNSDITSYVKRHHLSVVSQFTEGANNDGTYLVTDSTGSEKVLKVALSQHALEEIIMNMKGYEALRACDLESFIPGNIELETDEASAFLLMDYCGNNFLTTIKNTSDPIGVYQHLADELRKVYIKSRCKNAEGIMFLNSIFQWINETYQTYLRDEFDTEGTVLPLLSTMQQSFEKQTFEHVCFSNWDFTPEDVYLTPQGLKYSDPHEIVLGIPIIDMTCFSALVILYNLPEKESGFEILMKLVRNDIPQILGISSVQASALHALGKVLQRFLSSRFRISNRDSARKLFQEGVGYIHEVTAVLA